MIFSRLISKGLRIILQPPSFNDCSISKNSKVCAGSHLTNTVIGKYSYCGYDCFIVNSDICSFVSIADGCKIGGASHSMEYVSMSPVFESGHNVLKKNFANFNPCVVPRTVINSDVWIGFNTIILSGISVGTGSVIGAGSVVTKDIPPYEVWAGNPAKKIRDRFDENTKNKLLKSRWWEFEDDKIKVFSQYFNNPSQFIKYIDSI